MASKATERIRRVMTRLAMEGKLDKPYYPNGQRTPQSKVAHKRVQAEQRPDSSDDCCVGRLSRLPDGVVSCPDCPLDSDRAAV